MANTFVFPFHHKFITGKNPSLDVEFLRNHTRVWLRSDLSDKGWKVDLDGDKLAGGWEEFAAVSKFKDGEVLVFRHDGDENFHVSVSSASSSYVNIEDNHTDDDDDLDSTDDDDYYFDDDGGEEEDDEDEENIGDNNKKPEADSSSGNSCFITKCITRYSLEKDRLDLPKDFNDVLEENKPPHEIDLVNEQGRRWTLRLAVNISSGVFYIRQGWSNFCSANKLSQGDSCKFKVVNIGKRPRLFLCPKDSSNAREEKEEGCPEADATKNCYVGGCSKEKKKTHSPLLTFKYSPSQWQQYISSAFVRKHGLKDGEIMLLDNDGRKWSSCLRLPHGRTGDWLYLRRGWKEMCVTNGLKENDSFVVELIWEDANPMFKFVSKIESKGSENQKTRKKRACETREEAPSVVEEPVKKRVTRRSLHQEEEKRGSCSVTDQVSNVRQGVLDTLNTIRDFQIELGKREEDLEASLKEIDVLGESISGFSKYFGLK